MNKALEIKKKEGESAPAVIYRFNKKIQQSGLFKEVKKRRFRDRIVNKNKRKASSLYRAAKQKEVTRLKKLGKL